MDRIEAASKLYELYVTATQHEISFSELSIAASKSLATTWTYFVCSLFLAALLSLCLHAVRQQQNESTSVRRLKRAFAFARLSSWLIVGSITAYLASDALSGNSRNIRTTVEAWRTLVVDISAVGLRNRLNDPELSGAALASKVSELVQRAKDLSAASSATVPQEVARNAREQTFERVFGTGVTNEAQVRNLEINAPEYFRAGRWMFLAPRQWPVAVNTAAGDLPRAMR